MIAFLLCVALFGWVAMKVVNRAAVLHKKAITTRESFRLVSPWLIPVSVVLIALVFIA